MNSSAYENGYRPTRGMAQTLTSKLLISAANFVIVLLAITIMILSLGAWSDFVVCSFTIVIALAWTCCVCVRNNQLISAYCILMIIDMILLLLKAILYIVDLFSYDSYCFNNNDNITNRPPNGCEPYRNGQKAAIVAMVCCFLVAIICRLINIIGSCMLAYEEYSKTDQEEQY